MNPLFWLLGALAAVFVLIAIKIFKKGSPKDSGTTTWSISRRLSPCLASDGTQNDNDKKEDEEIDQRRRVPRGRTARARLIEGRRRAERDDVEFGKIKTRQGIEWETPPFRRKRSTGYDR